mgnify:CR=1 FL=1
METNLHLQLARKEPVKLRYKSLVNGNKSLYFDIYVNGKRKYEFLRLYLVPEADKYAKEQNRRVLDIAYKLKQKRLFELFGKRLESGSVFISSEEDKRLIDVVEAYAVERKKAGQGEKEGRYGSVMTLKMHLIVYAGENVLMSQVDKDFCIGFARYLKTAKNLHQHIKSERYLSDGTAYLKYSMFRCVLNDAVRKGYIEKNPTKLVPAIDRPKKPDTERDYLSVEEVKLLMKTPCPYKDLKLAFLFSCFTGLRKSDILDLRWKNISNNGNKYQIYKRIQKTQRWQTIPLSEQAMLWLPARRDEPDDARIFQSMSNSSLAANIKKWAKMAGIKHKRVTFHVARHTFATLELSLGVDLYTVSKLLGHSNIATTQIYAKVVDKQKEQAVDLIDGVF